MVLSNAYLLQRVDRSMLDFSTVAVKVTVPAGLDTLPVGPQVTVRVWKVKGDAPIAVSGALVRQVADNGWIYTISQQDLQRAAALQATVSEWISEGADVGDNYQLKLNGCRTGAPVDMDQRITVSVKWGGSSRFRKILSRIPLRKLFGETRLEDLPKCHN